MRSLIADTPEQLAGASEVERSVQHAVDQMRLQAAEREPRLMQTIYLTTAAILAGLAIATGIIIAFTWHCSSTSRLSPPQPRI